MLSQNGGMKENRFYRARVVVTGAIALLLVVPAFGAVQAAAEGKAQVEAAPEQPNPGNGGGCCGCCGGGQRQCCQGQGADSQMGKGPGHGKGCGRMQRGRGAGAGAGRGMMGHRSQMQNAHALIASHAEIERQVELLDDGVRTVTTSANPELVETLRRHVTEMKQMIEEGGRIRNWDPLFATIFDHRDAIVMRVEEVEGGVAVTETSTDPAVAALIQAHAAKVDDFVARGPAAYRESTPLPDDYLARGAEKPAGGRGIPCWTGGS